jgi:hypothetical protein
MTAMVVVVVIIVMPTALVEFRQTTIHPGEYPAG